MTKESNSAIPTYFPHTTPLVMLSLVLGGGGDGDDGVDGDDVLVL